MESWQGLNYSTTLPEEWLHLMNLSTADFGVAPFPSNVIAIPDTLWNRTNHSIPFYFPNDTIIIENASKAQVGSRDIERIVFLSTSGLAIIWAIWWLWINQGSLLRPRPRHSPPGTGKGSSSDIELEPGAGSLATNPNFLSASEFRRRVEGFYPRNIYSGIELVEKDFMYDQIDGEDVEDVVHMVQKMYEADLAVWSLQNVSHRGSEAEKAELKRRSDGILREVRRKVVEEWNREPSLGRWNGEERRLLEGIRKILVENLPDVRYPENR
ncbi:hypothetical protein V8F20_012795 [Naviculisporaceae sp. PSN 640]